MDIEPENLALIESDEVDVIIGQKRSSGKVSGTVLGAVMIQMIQSGLVYMQVDMYIQIISFYC